MKRVTISASQFRRLRKIESAAKKLWHAHSDNHDTAAVPYKYMMNYGELVALADAIWPGVVPETQT